jgi:hypothetical protein
MKRAKTPVKVRIPQRSGIQSDQKRLAKDRLGPTRICRRPARPKWYDTKLKQHRSALSQASLEPLAFQRPLGASRDGPWPR